MEPGSSAQEQQAQTRVTSHALPHAVPQLFDAACRAISGRRRTILAVLDNRVTWGAVKHWRKGRRRAPQWALQAVLSTIEAKAAPLDHVLNMAKQKARDDTRASRYNAENFTPRLEPCP